MTEYWVSQGNKWCDFCKIFISNNPATIRNHELGQRHKDNVAQRLATMRHEKAAKDKELKEAARALEQIEAKAMRSYNKDVASFEETKDSSGPLLGDEEWEYDSKSGYYRNQSNGIFYDPRSCFYYSDFIGKWVTQEEAFAASQVSSGSTLKDQPVKKKPLSGTTPGPVISGSLNPMRSVKSAPSSLSVGKRKRLEKKPKVLSAEEAAALKAREAAKKRVEEREKHLVGLYKH